MNHFYRLIFSFMPIFSFTGKTVFGWNDHEKITAEALSHFTVLENQPDVFYRPLNDALNKKLTVSELNQSLKIQKKYDFPLKMDEKIKKHFKPIEILSTYSGEPDWGADQELFEQYPELWTPDTAYIAVKHGTGSQGFRHMYFPGRFSWWSPIASFQVPMRPLGEAPQRAEIFLKLSQRFFADGFPYWGYRFLAWSLHYMEDLFQPFHSCQTPTKRLIHFKWDHFFPAVDTAATAESITYYHFSYEWWQEQQMKPENSRLVGALHLKSSESPESLKEDLVEYILQNVVAFSSAHARTVGSLAFKIFPAFDPRGTLKPADIVGGSEWQAQIKNGPLTEELTKVTSEIFSRMGETTRALVLSR